jgi:TM2 domain-containing membrane protein YozV
MARANPNPVVAGVLSALLAGAGQVYNGQRKKGVTYMAVEAAFLILLFTVLLVMLIERPRRSSV